MTWTPEQHRAAVQAAKARTADETQLDELARATQQAGSRGNEAREALRGK